MSDAIALDAELADFIQGAVSLHAASRDARNVPNLARAVGCRVSADGRRVTLFLQASHCATMLADFRDNGAVALVASLPRTHRTVQLKGSDAAIEALRDDDAVRVARYREAFAAQLSGLGYDADIPRTLLSGPRSDFVAVSFTVSAAFVQTPGPGAGSVLRP
jgi:hypothetical protein